MITVESSCLGDRIGGEVPLDIDRPTQAPRRGAAPPTAKADRSAADDRRPRRLARCRPLSHENSAIHEQGIGRVRIHRAARDPSRRGPPRSPTWPPRSRSRSAREPRPGGCRSHRALRGGKGEHVILVRRHVDVGENVVDERDAARAPARSCGSSFERVLKIPERPFAAPCGVSLFFSNTPRR